MRTPVESNSSEPGNVSTLPVIISNTRRTINQQIGSFEYRFPELPLNTNLDEKISAVRGLGRKLLSERVQPGVSEERLGFLKERISDLEKLEALYLQLSDVLTWVKPQELVTSRIDARLFVDPDDSIKFLQDCHRKNATLIAGGCSSGFVLLMNNHKGMSNLQFAYHYLAKCQGLARDAFGQSISNARALCVTLTRGSLILDKAHAGSNKMEWERRLRDNMVDHVRRLIMNGTLSGKLSRLDHCRTSADVILQIIEDTQTPLFLLLDDIGPEFTTPDTTVTEAVERFHEFCRLVAEPWIMIKHLYFLLVGDCKFSVLRPAGSKADIVFIPWY
jgi:hypothetical protein